MRTGVTEKIRRKLHEKLSEAGKQNHPYLDITSGELYVELQEELNLPLAPPNRNHRMPQCCDAMLSLQNEDDEILHHPPKYHGKTLTIRYKLPR